MKSKKKMTVKTVQQPAAQLDLLPRGYANLLKELREKIGTTRVKAALAANREMILLYWQIGKAPPRSNREKTP